MSTSSTIPDVINLSDYGVGVGLREPFIQSTLAEQSVLGALLIDNRSVDAVIDTVREVDFVGDGHRAIFRAATALIHAGKTADVITVYESMKRTGTAENDTLSYLNGLATNTPGASGARSYARIVRDRAIEREISAAGTEMAEIAQASTPLSEKLERITQIAYSLTENTVSDDPESIGAYLPEAKARLQERIERGGAAVGLKTGLRAVDRELAGLHAGQFVILAGRPGMGKTAVAVQFAMAAGLAGVPVLIFEMEMTREELIERMLSNLAGVDSTRIRSGTLDEREIARIEDADNRLRAAPIFIDELPGRSPAQIRARARRIKRKHGLGLIVVDHIGLARGAGEKRYEQIGDITRSLKALAKELHVPVMALCQINRGIDNRQNRRPKMADLRESGDIEQDADVVIMAYRDEYYDASTPEPGVVELWIEKQRNGPTGCVKARWEGAFTRVCDLDPNYQPPPVPKRRPAPIAAFPE